MSASNGAILLSRVVFTTKTIDEMRTFGTPSPPMTLDNFEARYHAVWSVAAEVDARRERRTRLRGRGFCIHPAEMVRRQGFRPSTYTGDTGKARANEASWPKRRRNANKVLQNIIVRPPFYSQICINANKLDIRGRTCSQKLPPGVDQSM